MTCVHALAIFSKYDINFDNYKQNKHWPGCLGEIYAALTLPLTLTQLSRQALLSVQASEE